jgi:hypothetical protein
MNRGSGVVGSVVGIERWTKAYERELEKERELKNKLRKIDLLLEDAKKAEYLIDTAKLQRQKRDYEEELKAVRQRRLKLEWLAVAKIKRGAWSPEILKEYSFVQDLLLLNRIREEQVREICQNCKECRIIRVKVTDGKEVKEVPLDAVTRPDKACSLPYLPYYSVKEIWKKKQELQVNTETLGPLTPEEKEKVEKWTLQRLALYRDLLNSFIEEKRIIIPSRKLLYRGCTRKLPKILPVREKEIREEDVDPKTPDHFPEDIVGEVNEDGTYSRVFVSAKHGSEESE